MKKAWILVGTVVVIALLYFRMKSQAPEVNSGVPDALVAPLPPVVAPVNMPAVVVSPTPPATSSPAGIPSQESSSAFQDLKRRPPIEKQIPKLQDVRNEIAKNPHVTPHSLVQFSADLGDKMVLALQSKEASQFMMKQLDACASGEAVATASSASAVCIKSAYELSAKYPELIGDSDKIRDHADPEALKIYRGMKRLGL